MNIRIREFDGMRDWGWFTSRNPIKRVEDTSGIVAEDEDSGEILAIVVCDTWYANSVNMHVCVDNSAPAKYGFIEEVFKHVFLNPEHKDIEVAYGFVPVGNDKALKLDKNLGFTHEYTLSSGKGAGFHIVSMAKENCKFIKGVEHGRT